MTTSFLETFCSARSRIDLISQYLSIESVASKASSNDAKYGIG